MKHAHPVFWQGEPNEIEAIANKDERATQQRQLGFAMASGNCLMNT